MPFVLADLLSANQATRVQAEAELKALQETHPEELCQALIRESQAGAENNIANPVATLALVMLRQTLKMYWLSDEAELQKIPIGSLLLSTLLETGNETPGVQKLVEAFVSLPPVSLQEFTPTVIQAVVSAPTGSKATLLLIDGFAEFAYSPDLAAPFAGRLIAWLQAGERSEFLFKAAVSLLVAASQGEGQKQEILITLGQELPILAVRFAAETGGSAGEVVLEALCTLADSCAWVFEAKLRDTCNALLDVCEAAIVGANIRSLAMAVFGSVVARKANSVCKDAEFCTRIVRCLLQFQVEEDEYVLGELFTEEIDEGDLLCASQIGLRGSALDCASNLALGSARVTVDSRQFLGLLLSQVKPLLGSTSWIHRLAGLSMVGVIAAPMSVAVFRPVLKDVVQGCMQMTLNKQEHAKVRFAASGVVFQMLSAGGWMAKEIRGELHSEVIASLATCLSGEQVDEQLSAVWLMTLCKFYSPNLTTQQKESDEDEDDEENEDAGQEKLPEASVSPYLDGIVSLLVRLMQHTNDRLLRLAMDALAALGSQTPEFAKFYPDLVPGIKHVLGVTKDSSVKKSAMLLVASCAEAVGKERFATDAMEVVGWFLNQNKGRESKLDETNEVEALFVFCERVSALLQTDFAVFTPHVLPLVVSALQADLGISISNRENAKDSFEEDSGNATVNLSMRGVVGPIEISANIYAFQLRFRALHLLTSLAENSCIPSASVPELMSLVLPNVADRLCTANLNCQACETACDLFFVVAKDKAVEWSPDLFVLLGTQFLTGLAHEPSSASAAFAPDEIDRRSAFAGAFERLVRICYVENRPGTPVSLIPNVFHILMNSLVASVNRRLGGAIGTELHALGFDREQLEMQIEAIQEEEVELATMLIDALGFLLKSDSLHVWPEYQTQVLEFMVQFVSHSDEHLRHASLCCFVDAMEFGSQDDRVAMVLRDNLRGAICSEENALLRQVGAYGVGILALKAAPGNDEWTEEYAKLLLYRMSKDEAESEVTDNVVSALAKLHCRLPARVDWQLAVLQHVPLRADEEEAIFVHDWVLRLVSEDQLANPSQNESRVVSLCAMLLHQHLQKETVLCSDRVLSELVPIAVKKIGAGSVERLEALLGVEVDASTKQALLGLVMV